MKKFKVAGLKLTKELMISRDFNIKPKFFFPVFLFEPFKEPTHYHICLTKKQAKKLRDWLDEYLRERGEL